MRHGLPYFERRACFSWRRGVQLLLIAAGFTGAQSYVAQSFGVDLTQRNCVATGEGQYRTSVPKVFTAGETWHSLWNTIKYALIEVPFGVVIALILAVFLNKKLKGTSLFRTIFFLPMVCAPAAVAMVWKWLYNQQFGLINNVFGTDIAWISDPKIAWISIGIIGVWSIIGYNMVLFISGLQEIPGDYYEAAEIDGATGIRQFFHITVPLLSPTTFFIVQTRVIGALTIFDLMFMVMDKTNLALENTQSIVYLFYTYAFTNGDKGYGATIVVFLVIFIMIVTFILQRAEKKLVYHP